MTQEVTFITRFYPPSPNINGESVCDMVDYLQKEHAIKCNVICSNRSFEGGGQTREPKGNVIRIKTLASGKNPLSRFISFLYDGYSLIRHSLKFKDSIIIVTTSPPLLPFWASLFYKSKVKWGVWTLDLFPEGFSAMGKIGKNNLFYKWVKKKTYGNKPTFLITLGPKQHQHLEKEYNSSIPSSILPCGVFFDLDLSNQVPEWKKDDLIYFGYCGNIGGAHNPQFLKTFIDKIDPLKHRLILALYGIHAPELKKYAKDKPGVVLVDSVPRNQLHFIDIHLVTLRTSWTHIAVPSKAVSAVSMNGSLIFCGSKESDNWHMFKDSGWLVNEDEDLSPQIEDILGSLSTETINKKKQAAKQSYAYLKECVTTSYQEVAERIKKT